MIVYADLHGRPGCGEFIVRETRAGFTFHPTHDAWALSRGFTHEIDMSDGSVRYATILQTVAYVAVDEAADGSAITEKWQLARRVDFCGVAA